MKKIVILFILIIFMCSTSFAAYHNNEHPPQVVAKGKQNSDMYKSGFIDVTWYDGWQGNRVDPTGNVDSLWAIEKAIEDGLAYELAVYFPSGTYLISDTLSVRRNGNSLNAREGGVCSSPSKTNVLIGDPDNRPTIKLKDNQAKFSNKDTPRFVVAIWNWRNPDCSDKDNAGIRIRGEEFLTHDANGFKQMIKNIDIDVGNNNEGAIGLKFEAAQGSTIENVKVNARDGFAGIYDIPSRAGGVINTEVIGGDYGLYLDTGATFTVVGARLIDQKIAAITASTWTPTMLVGLYIESNGAPAYRSAVGDGHFTSSAGSITMIDSEIVMKNGGTAIDNVLGRDFYLENIYVRGADVVVDSEGEKQNSRGTWTRIDEYNYVSKDEYQNQRDRGFKTQWGEAPSWRMVDGSSLTKTTLSSMSSSSAPTEDFIVKHTPGREPFFLDSDVKNAVLDLGIDNTGNLDVTNKLQNAINNHEKIFLPSGRYVISDTITLGKHTKLFSHDFANTRISTNENWKPTSRTYMIETVNDVDATTYLSDIIASFNGKKVENAYFGAVNWRAGSKSIFKKMDTKFTEWIGGSQTERKLGVGANRYKFSGNAGGKMYTIYTGKSQRTNHPDFRYFEIEGTSQPLTFYSFNPEHAAQGPFLDIRNSKNVRIFGIKTECTEQFAKIVNSENIGIFNYGVGCSPDAGDGPITHIINSKDVKLANFNFQFYPLHGNPMVREEYFGEVNEMQNEILVSMFKRGDFDNSIFDSGQIPPSEVSSCYSFIKPGDPIPQGYGSAYDLDTNRLEFDGYCSNSYLNIEVDTPGASIIYEKGYYWKNDRWNEFSLSGTKVGDSPWIRNYATKSISGLDFNRNNYILTYICDHDGDRWKCGCREAACTRSSWNIQIFKPENVLLS